jgi:uncharacterized membrane protein
MVSIEMGQIMSTEIHLRTIVRTVSWRLIATLVTSIWTGLNSAVAIHIVLAVLHYVFERLWLKINWGFKKV